MAKLKFFSEKWGIPEIHGVGEYKETTWIPFNYAKRMKPQDISGKTCHFFLDDYQFERVFNNPERYVKVLSDFDDVLAPDFSLFIDDPLPVQLYNHYKKQYISAFWEMRGINVIPTVCWSDEDSFDWCFSGIPHNSILAVSSVGTQKSRITKDGFLKGYQKMVEKLKPEKVLFYGIVPNEIESTKVIQIHPFWESIVERRKK